MVLNEPRFAGKCDLQPVFKVAHLAAGGFFPCTLTMESVIHLAAFGGLLFRGAESLRMIRGGLMYGVYQRKSIEITVFYRLDAVTLFLYINRGTLNDFLIQKWG